MYNTDPDTIKEMNMTRQELVAEIERLLPNIPREFISTMVRILETKKEDRDDY
jgi:hypothetical protein